MSNSELIGSSTRFKEEIAQAIHEAVLAATIVSRLSIARLSDSRNSRNSLNSCESREKAANLSPSSFLFINLEVARALLSPEREIARRSRRNRREQ